MQAPNKPAEVPRRVYRPKQRLCPICHSVLKRSYTLWRKRLIFLTDLADVTSWVYQCPDPACAGADETYFSEEAETLHLRHRFFGREVIVHIGYRRFWYHQTMYEIHDWLTQDLGLIVSDRHVLNLIGDFLALLRAAQPAKVCTQLKKLKYLLVGLDGMQPEKGNACLYIVRELQSDLTLLAENLDESSDGTIRTRLLQPLKDLAKEMGLSWHGVVSDAQESIRTAVAKELPNVPHQACQSHCLRKAGDLAFNADRNMKKRLKATYRQRLRRVEQRIACLPETDPYRPVLADYADAIRSTLLQDGVAPFELGGLQVFDDLTTLAASLARCQKKGGIYSSAA
jgi:hypothetical protein